jgi:DNA-dependent RNA polymerase auxiliary subunit epsilon
MIDLFLGAQLAVDWIRHFELLNQFAHVEFIDDVIDDEFIEYFKQ